MRRVTKLKTGAKQTSHQRSLAPQRNGGGEEEDDDGGDDDEEEEEEEEEGMKTGVTVNDAIPTNRLIASKGKPSSNRAPFHRSSILSILPFSANAAAASLRFPASSLSSSSACSRPSAP